MKKALVLIGCLSVPASAGQGPISKFNAKAPDIRMTSHKSLGDLERCMIDIENVNAPLVYKQADRPNHATILWTLSYGQAVSRLDLEQTGSTVKITGWNMPSPKIRRCAEAA